MDSRWRWIRPAYSLIETLLPLRVREVYGELCDKTLTGARPQSSGTRRGNQPAITLECQGSLPDFEADQI
jgi:hypothetical protein